MLFCWCRADWVSTRSRSTAQRSATMACRAMVRTPCSVCCSSCCLQSGGCDSHAMRVVGALFVRAGLYSFFVRAGHGKVKKFNDDGELNTANGELGGIEAT